MTNSDAYQKCLQLEKAREEQWRETDQGRFESSMLSMETLNHKFDDPSKVTAFGDNGMGSSKIKNYESIQNDAKERAKKIDAARKKLIRNGGKYLLGVFYLVIKNSTNWEQSVCELMEKINARKAKAAKNTSTKKPSIGRKHTTSILDTSKKS